MTDPKEITLGELVKLNPDYLRIQDLDGEPWIYASKDHKVKVAGDITEISKEYRVNLPVTIVQHGDGPQAKSLGFSRYGDAPTLKCLLAHRPESLHIEYYRDSQSEYMKRHGITQETVRVKAVKGRRCYEVRFNTPRAVQNDNQFAYIANFGGP